MSHSSGYRATGSALFRGNVVSAGTIGEKFHVSPFPRSPLEFWQHVAQHGIQLAVQFQEGAPGFDYHAETAGVPFLSFKTDPATSTTVVLTSDEVESGLRYRKYALTETRTASDGDHLVHARNLHHLQIHWPDFGLPDSGTFDALFTRYLNLLRAASDGTEPLGCGCNVFVHCMGGYGRSGTFVFARVLHGAGRWTNEDADIMLEQLRTQRHLVETEAQEAFAKAAARRMVDAKR